MWDFVNNINFLKIITIYLHSHLFQQDSNQVLCELTEDNPIKLMFLLGAARGPYVAMSVYYGTGYSITIQDDIHIQGNTTSLI